MTRRIHIVLGLCVLAAIATWLALSSSHKGPIVVVRHVPPDFRSAHTRETFYASNSTDLGMYITGPVMIQEQNPAGAWQDIETVSNWNGLFLSPNTEAHGFLPSRDKRAIWRVRFTVHMEAVGIAGIFRRALVSLRPSPNGGSMDMERPIYVPCGNVFSPVVENHTK
jgi:hypothetical protein